MSNSSTAIGSLFEVQRTMIDQTIETQEAIDRRGFDLTRRTVKPLVDAAVAHEGAGVSDLEGIGVTYADRLADAGVRTQDRFAWTSAHEVAEIADVSEDQAVAWVERARDGV